MKTKGVKKRLLDFLSELDGSVFQVFNNQEDFTITMDMWETYLRHNELFM